MAYALRATYTQENNYGTTDLLEIYEDGFVGSVIELGGRSPCAFDFEHREITGIQRDYLSIFENQVLMGVLDLYAWIDTTAKKTLVTDIADSPTKQFKVIWKRNGTAVWHGFPYGRVIDYPEMPQYNVKIQFRDFEILKGEDYPLEDDRQKIITTFAGIFNQLGFSQSIKTHTSWQCEGTTVTDDFLNQVYHDTYALRDYAGDGYSADQQISYYQALLRTADPMLVVYQWKGFNIFQISDCKTPASMKYAVYNSAGTQTTSTTADRSYAISDSPSNQPSAKTISNNTSYPALKRAVYEFNHNSGSSEFSFITKGGGALTPTILDTGGNEYYRASTPFSGSGDERLEMSALCYKIGAFDEPGTLRNFTRAVLSVGDYVLNGSTWMTVSAIFSAFPTRMYWEITNTVASINTTTGEISQAIEDGSKLVTEIKHMPVRLLTTGTLPNGWESDKTYYVQSSSGGIPSATNSFYLSDSPGGSTVIPTDAGTGTLRIIRVDISQTMQEKTIDVDDVPVVHTFGLFSKTTGNIPDAAEGTFEIVLMSTVISPAPELNPYNGDYVEWFNVNAVIINPTQAGQSIEYRLTQTNDYSESLRLPDSYFGDGPYEFSRSSYRTSASLSAVTAGWRRRGDTTYIPYSRLKLNEVLDYQRVRQLKKTFEISGEIEPDKVAVYDSDPFMYVGGKYNGRWKLIGVKVEENTDG